jgi:hypothetical protein
VLQRTSPPGRQAPAANSLFVRDKIASRGIVESFAPLSGKRLDRKEVEAVLQATAFH